MVVVSKHTDYVQHSRMLWFDRTRHTLSWSQSVCSGERLSTLRVFAGALSTHVGHNGCRRVHPLGVTVQSLNHDKGRGQWEVNETAPTSPFINA